MKTEQSAHTINNNNIVQAKRASADFYCLNRLLIVIMIGVCPMFPWLRHDGGVAGSPRRNAHN